MREIIQMMSQRLHLPHAIQKIENAIIRYGQLIISFIIIGMIAYGYIVIQNMILGYLSNFGTNPPEVSL
jgi:hypothetical protein